MTIDTRSERRLTATLEELYLGPTPDYRDEVLAAAGRVRQRPAWTFPGRWLPMLEIAVRPVATPRLPVRAIGLTLLIIALLLAALLAVGAHRRVAPPFGPAGNGLVAWALDGDIWTGDPVTGSTQRVVGTTDIDRNPIFSKDGTELAFLRQVPTETGHFDLMVVHPDGSAPVKLTPVPIETPDAVQWVPDSRSLLVNEPDGKLTRYFLDGSAPKQVLDGVHIEPDAFRPPSGSQILYERDDDQGALYVINVDGSSPHELFGPATAPCQCSFRAPARWSPDGRMVAFGVQAYSADTRMYVVNADASDLRQVSSEDGNWVEADPAWSPDGTRLAFNRWQTADTTDWTNPAPWVVRPIAVVDVEHGTLRPVGVAPASEGALIEWAPDGQAILSLPGTLVDAFTWAPSANGTVARPVLIDVHTGGSRTLDWSVGSIATWQRLAP